MEAPITVYKKLSLIKSVVTLNLEFLIFVQNEYHASSHMSWRHDVRHMTSHATSLSFELLRGPAVDSVWDWVEVEEEPRVHGAFEVDDLHLAVAGFLYLRAWLPVQVAAIEKS